MAVQFYKKAFSELAATKKSPLFKGMSPELSVAYNAKTVAAMDVERIAAMNFYLANKGRVELLKDAPASDPFTDATSIITPHPVGDTPILSILLSKAIEQIEHLEVREQEKGKYSKEPAKVHKAIRRYLQDIIDCTEDELRGAKKLAETEPAEGASTKEKKEYAQLNDYIITGSAVNVAVKAILDTALAEAESLTWGQLQPMLDPIKAQLAKLSIQIGIPVEIVSRQVQEFQISSKRKLLDKAHNAPKAQWALVDADGDALNGVTVAFGIEDGLTLEEAYIAIAKQSATQNRPIYQPRISCKDKKGVIGVETQLANITGMNEVTQLEHILGDDFDKLYHQFKGFIKDKKLATKSWKDGGDAGFPEGQINSIVGLIAQLTVFGLNNGETDHSLGTVLSDFPGKLRKDEDEVEKGRLLVLRLKALTKCAERYLHENAKIQEAVALGAIKKPSLNAVVLPLAENKTSIARLSNITQKWFENFEQEYNKALELEGEAKESKLNELRALFVAANNKYASVGSFVGPSDATDDMGTQSMSELHRTRDEFTQQFKKYAEIFSELRLEGINIAMAHGVGTTRRRGDELIRSGPETKQSTADPKQHSSSAKMRVRLARGQKAADSKPLEGSYTENTPFGADKKSDDAFKEAAIKAHKQLADPDGERKDGKGIITWHDTHLDSIFLKISDKRYGGNQGTRGKDGLSPYESRRAIESAFTMLGLFTFMGAGLPDFSKPENIKHHAFDLHRALSTSAGTKIIIDELIQAATFDERRLRQIGIDEGTIAELTNYVDASLAVIAKNTGSEVAGGAGGVSSGSITESRKNEALKILNHLCTKKEFENLPEQTRRALAYAPATINSLVINRDIATSQIEDLLVKDTKLKAAEKEMEDSLSMQELAEGIKVVDQSSVESIATLQGLFGERSKTLDGVLTKAKASQTAAFGNVARTINLFVNGATGASLFLTECKIDPKIEFGPKSNVYNKLVVPQNIAETLAGAGVAIAA